MGRPKAQFCKHGHDTAICGRDKSNACKDCKKVWFDENPTYLKEYYEENKDAMSEQKKEHYEEHKDEILARNTEWRNTHRELKVELDRQYFINNREKCLANNLRNETNRNLRIVAWTDWDEILEIYKKQPEGTDVDHYIPLQGKKVAGLHVSWNLQYLPKHDNRVKHNKIDLLQASEWYGKILDEAGLK